MDLYAAGSNAWNQLRFGQEALDPEPDDICSFTLVLSAISIKPPVSRLAYTLVEADAGFVVAGSLENPLDDGELEGLQTLLRSVETATGRTMSIEQDQQTTLSSLTSGKNETSPWTMELNLPVVQLGAYDAGFVALLSNSSVWVNGDERFPDCLALDDGRTPELWNRVSWLDDLPTGPVVKVAAGGYTLAALTEGGDLYCWGGRSGQRPLIQDLSSMPIPVDLGDTEIKDVAIGDRHILALTSDGKVFVRGDNKNGQLGLPEGTRSVNNWVEDWTLLEDIPVGNDSEITGVAAGPRTSFIITRKRTKAAGKDS